MQIRGVLRNIFLSTTGTFKKASPGVYILNGHYINKNNLDSSPFRKQLSQLRKIAQLVDIETAVEAIEVGREVKETLVAFTFDDGFEDCYSLIAPALDEYNVNAAFFINPGFIESNNDYRLDFTKNKTLSPGKKPMSWTQVTELATSGFVIGNHSYDHQRLTTSDFSVLKHQILNSKFKIEEKTRIACNYFAYPYGQLNDISEEALNFSAKHHKYVFSGTDYRNYFSFNGRVHNRRHFEGSWPLGHLTYFLSFERHYPNDFRN